MTSVLRSLACLIIISIVVASAAAQNTRVLVPLHVSATQPIGPWLTRISILNLSSSSVSTPGVTFWTSCPGAFGCFGTEIPAHRYAELASPTSASGVVLEIPSTAVNNVVISAHVGALPEVPPVGASRLPIVPEHRFVNATMHIPYVARFGLNSTPVRTHIRVYSLDNRHPIRVRLDLRNWSDIDGAPIDSRVFELVPGVPPAPAAYRLIELQTEFPEVTATYYNVSVTPLAAADSSIPGIWAFASVTTNTNDVTITAAQ